MNDDIQPTSLPARTYGLSGAGVRIRLTRRWRRSWTASTCRGARWGTSSICRSTMPKCSSQKAGRCRSLSSATVTVAGVSHPPTSVHVPRPETPHLALPTTRGLTRLAGRGCFRRGRLPSVQATVALRVLRESEPCVTAANVPRRLASGVGIHRQSDRPALLTARCITSISACICPMRVTCVARWFVCSMMSSVFR